MTKWVIRGRQSTGSSVYAEAFRILLPLMRRCISVLSPNYLVFRGQDTSRSFCIGAGSCPLHLIWKPAVNATPIDTKQSRSLRDVAASLFQGSLDEHLLSRIQIQGNHL
jgi:hypothetical protein